MPTTPLGIWTPDDSDDWDLTVDLAANAISVDDAITDAFDGVRYFVGTNANRLAHTPASGDHWRTTDTNLDWVYRSGGWYPATPGYVLPQISRGGSGTISGTGGNTYFVNASSVTISGLTGRRYRISGMTSAATATAAFMMRLTSGGGTPISATNYTFQRNYGSGGSAISVNASGASAFELAGGSLTAANPYSIFEIEIENLTAASPTGVQYRTTIMNPSSNSLTGGGFYNQNTACDGFTIYPASGTISGQLDVFEVAY